MHPFAQNVEIVLSTLGKSQAWLARTSNVNSRTINGLFYQNKTPRLDTAIKIAKALNLSLDTLSEYDSPLNDAGRLQQLRYAFQITSILKSELNNFLNKEISSTKIDEQDKHVVQETAEVYTSSTHWQLPLHDIDSFEDTIHMTPALGATAAGPMVEMVEEREEVPVPMHLFPPRSNPHDFFCLTVRGDSMTEAGIGDGSIVLLRTCHIPEHGKIMLVRHEDLSTLKRVRRDDAGMWWLCWEDGSKRKEPIGGNDWAILAEFVAVVKT